MGASNGHRKRVIDLFEGSSLETTATAPFFGSPGTYSESTGSYRITGMQETISRDNPDWPTVKKLRRLEREGQQIASSEFIKGWDVGGSFLTFRNRHEAPVTWVRTPAVRSGLNTYTYRGPVFAKAANVGPTSYLWPSTTSIPALDEELITRGATAIARCIPTNPIASAAQILGELRERLPAVPGSRLASAGGHPSGKFADEYLNIEFGLKPLLSDFRKVGTAIRTQNRVLADLRRNSGRLVRRRYAFPPETKSEILSVSSGTLSPAVNTYLYEGLKTQGQMTHERTTTREFWFSGAFTYLYADSHGLLGQMQRAEQSANKLFGVRITPELFWELTPWSWAADWVSNTGDVLHNLSAFTRDGLVMKWGYMMGHEVVTDTYTLTGVSLKGQSSGPLVQSFTSDVKRRIKATPYGFGLDPGVDFTSRQWAILAALGISRGSRTL